MAKGTKKRSSILRSRYVCSGGVCSLRPIGCRKKLKIGVSRIGCSTGLCGLRRPSCAACMYGSGCSSCSSCSK